MIDFGGATYEQDSHASVVNTRQYRAPEVILGLRWLYPSDLWSVGCIIAELLLGDLLFATVRDGRLFADYFLRGLAGGPAYHSVRLILPHILGGGFFLIVVVQDFNLRRVGVKLN